MQSQLINYINSAVSVDKGSARINQSQGVRDGQSLHGKRYGTVRYGTDVTRVQSKFVRFRTLRKAAENEDSAVKGSRGQILNRNPTEDISTVTHTTSNLQVR